MGPAHDRLVVTNGVSFAAEAERVSVISALLGRIRRQGVARTLVEGAVRLRTGKAISRAKSIAASDLDAQAKFEAIYAEGVWASASPTIFRSESLSGHGSSERSTRVLRVELASFIAENAITSLFDAPCGDFHWMKALALPPDFHYIGGDIACTVIDGLVVRYSSHRRQFITCDITKDPFPRTDAWLCKDCLQHLSFNDVWRALRNFARSEIKWALISNHSGGGTNADICTGDFRMLDLTAAPFNLPPPRQVLRDSPIDGEPRGIAVWSRDELRTALSRADAVVHAAT